MIKHEVVKKTLSFEEVLQRIWVQLDSVKIVDTIFVSPLQLPKMWAFTDTENQTQYKVISHFSIAQVIRTFLINVLKGHNPDKSSFTNDDLIQMLSAPVYNRLPICFAVYQKDKRKILRVRNLCKAEDYLVLDGYPLEALQLYAVPNRFYLEFIFEHTLQHNVNSGVLTFSQIKRNDIPD